MRELHERAGIDYLGPYRSRGKSKKLADTLHALSRAVEVPAVDYPLYNAVTKLLGHRLNVAEENRSVTSEQWVETAITRYGCPIHPTTRDGFTASERRLGCTCSRRRSLEVRGVPGRGEREDHGKSGEGKNPTRSGGSRHVGVRQSDGGSSLLRREDQLLDRENRGSNRELAHRLAISSVYSSASCLEGRRVPLALDEVVDHHIHGSSFAGLPLLANNRDVLDSGLRLARKVASGQRGFDPYLFGRRVQPGRSGPKTRLVWMASLPTTIIGLAFSKPVQEALARNRPYIWGLRHHEEGSILSEMSGRFRYVYSLDWSAFDSSVSPGLINDMFRVVRSMLDLDDAQNELFWRYVNDFIHTRIVLPDGGVYQVHRGVPSGSAFTSLIDSMVNVYLTNYIWVRLTGHRLDHKQLLVMGDDAVIGSNERVELTDVARIADECGFKLNVEKSLVFSSTEDEEGIHFIGHYWLHGRPRRPVRELITRMALPERHAQVNRSRSLMRLGGYALSSVDGLSVLLQIYNQDSIVSALCQYLWDMRAEGYGDQLRAHDLPGDQRRRVLVEGEPMPGIVSGSGPHALLFASAF